MDKFTKHQIINLKNHPEYNEKWVQEIISKDLTILNLGDLVLKDTERYSGSRHLYLRADCNCCWLNS